ncbi:hypothetical protein EDB80DRAFT_693392 [Ilyonectria destructans]|nr:hypothetical protein EDB80DRAFT_693392 [Ilyonectria destructans]
MSTINGTASYYIGPRQDRPRSYLPQQCSGDHSQPLHHPNSNAPQQKFHESTQSTQLRPRRVHPCIPTPRAIAPTPYGHGNGHRHVLNHTQEGLPLAPDARSNIAQKNSTFVPDARANIQWQGQVQKSSQYDLTGYVNCFPANPGYYVTRQQYSPPSAAKPSMPSDTMSCRPSDAVGHKDSTRAQFRPDMPLGSKSRDIMHSMEGSDHRRSVPHGSPVYPSPPLKRDLKRSNGINKRVHETSSKPSPCSPIRKPDLSLILCDISPEGFQLPPIKDIFNLLPPHQRPGHMRKCRVQRKTHMGPRR